MDFFTDFAEGDIDAGDIRMHVRHGGTGSPLLLLHGHPRTHATWHRVAPLLAQHHHVVCPDLRGYGRSSTLPDAPRHEQQSKRAMAEDCVALMGALGHHRFAVAGHDRGSYVAFRLAMDHRDAVTSLTVMDGVPIGEALARCDARFAAMWWHWFFLGNPAAGAERAITADPDAWYRTDAHRSRIDERAWDDFHRAVHDPHVVHAMCEDYRAGLSVDRAADDADRTAGRRVTCPLLVLWALRDDMETLYGDPLAVWRTWADDVRGFGIASGHHMAEETPAEVAAAIAGFLAAT